MQHFKHISLLILLCGICSFANAQTKLLSPDEFLTHKLGERFTPHHQLVRYFEQVAAARPENVQLTQYGMTNEERPLMIAIVSSKENMARLEEIRKNNLRRTGLLDGAPGNDNTVIVWLSFSVHGNEACGSEASMQTIYELLTRPECSQWLNNTVVIIDPSLNPDGYHRYTHWYNGVTNKLLNTNPDSREHNEPWPGGRVNHYYFDLNRDWAWQTQVESQARIHKYLEWFPQTHADLHEMGHNEPYYFAPAAQPYHQYLTQWQADFQKTIGENHARYFDANGWLYFTREVFDLFYPSYGDTYPSYSGSIGMTYEEGGGPSAGRGIMTEMNDTLTLRDRIEHHKTTALSTIEISSKNAGPLVQNFTDFFKRSNQNPAGPYKSYIIKGTNPPARIKALCDLLDKNDIRYGRVTDGINVRGFNYASGKEETVNVSNQDLVISAYQPMSVLTQVLFDPESKLVDSATYDITAWTLPCAYGLESYASIQKFNPTQPYTFVPASGNAASIAKPYAYLSAWNSLRDAKFLAALLQKNIQVRCAREPFEVEGKKYAAGTLIISRGDNADMPAFDATVQSIAIEMNAEVNPVKTGFVSSGRDLGSSHLFPVHAPKVLVVSGDEVDNNAFGHVWHYFENDLSYPLTIINANELGKIDLRNYTVLVLPDGYYTSIDSSVLDKLRQWISAGGHLIAMEGALSVLEDQKGFNLSKFATDKEKEDAKKQGEDLALSSRMDQYGIAERKFLSGFIPGSILKTKVDITHPIGFGLSDAYFTLKTNSRTYRLLKDAWNVAYVPADYISYGYIGSTLKEKMKETMNVSEQHMGRGVIVYMADSPLFRGFWYQGKLLFSNALFFSGN